MNYSQNGSAIAEERGVIRSMIDKFVGKPAMKHSQYGQLYFHHLDANGNASLRDKKGRNVGCWPLEASGLCLVSLIDGAKIDTSTWSSNCAVHLAAKTTPPKGYAVGPVCPLGGTLIREKDGVPVYPYTVGIKATPAQIKALDAHLTEVNRPIQVAEPVRAPAMRPPTPRVIPPARPVVGYVKEQPITVDRTPVVVPTGKPKFKFSTTPAPAKFKFKGK